MEEDKDPVLAVIKWEEFLKDFTRDGDYIHGYVTDETSVDAVLELYRRATKTAFCVRRSSSFQFGPLKCKTKKFCTRSFVFCRSTSPRIRDDGVPFTYGGMKILECQHGPKREHGKKRDVSKEKMDSAQEKKKSRQRLSVGETRKKGCQAKISVWHICRLPEYAVTAKKSVTVWQTRAKERLLQDLEMGKEVRLEDRFYISLPLQKAHTKHSPCGQSDKVHPQIIQWIDQLVAQGVTSIRDVQAVLKHYVQTRMSDIVAPDEQDRAYYPTLKDIANHIYKSKVRRRVGKLGLVPLGREEDVRSGGGGEPEAAGNGDDETPPSSPPRLQLHEQDCDSEDTTAREEVLNYPDEAACTERTELLKELNAIRRSSNKCADAAKLAELRAGIKALHDKFKTSLKAQSSSPSVSAHTQMLKRQKQDANAAALPPTKTFRRDDGDHAY